MVHSGPWLWFSAGKPSHCVLLVEQLLPPSSPLRGQLSVAGSQQGTGGIETNRNQPSNSSRRHNPQTPGLMQAGETQWAPDTGLCANSEEILADWGETQGGSGIWPDLRAGHLELGSAFQVGRSVWATKLQVSVRNEEGLLCLEHRDKKLTIREGTIGVSVVGSFGGIPSREWQCSGCRGSPGWKVNPQLEWRCWARDPCSSERLWMRQSGGTRLHGAIAV